MVQWGLRIAAALIWLGITSAFLSEPTRNNDNSFKHTDIDVEALHRAGITLSAETTLTVDTSETSGSALSEKGIISTDVNAIDRSINEISPFEEIPQSEKPTSARPHRDICTSLCAGNVHSATKELAKHCEKGCRFFDMSLNAEQSNGKHKDLNATKEKCSKSCHEAYDNSFVQNCLIGCSEMHRFQKEALLFFVQQQGDSGILEVEVSLVSDPALWEQTLTPNNAYKIPQTYMRTMPIRPELAEVIDTKNWPPCAPPTSEIPRWLVGLIAIGLTIFTLYVSFILPARGDMVVEEGEFDRSRPNNGSLYEEDLRKELGYLYHGDYYQKKEGFNDHVAANLNLVTLNDFLVEDYHFNVVPPPKYTLLPVDHKHSPV